MTPPVSVKTIIFQIVLYLSILIELRYHLSDYNVNDKTSWFFWNVCTTDEIKTHLVLNSCIQWLQVNTCRVIVFT